MTRLRVAPALLALLLGSCQLGLEVRVAGPPSAPVIEIDDGSDEGPTIDHVSVWRADATQPTWEIDAADCTAITRIPYGGVPAGFAAAGAAPPLEPGRAYKVVVMGCGYSGGAWFRIAGGRIISRNGTGDRPRREVEAVR